MISESGPAGMRKLKSATRSQAEMKSQSPEHEAHINVPMP